MRAVIQRVTEAEVTVAQQVAGRIEHGLVALVGFAETDRPDDLGWMARKIAGLCIFNDNEGKMNLSLADINGQALIVSQFTLFGDCRKGKRPSFESAAGMERAKALYEYLVEKCKQSNLVIGKGVFRESMLVDLVNDGPVTILLDSKKIF